MSDTRKQHWVLLIAFALPLLLIGGLSLSVYWPQWQLDPEYDFVYTNCSSFDRFTETNCEDYLGKRFTIDDDGTIQDTATSTEDARQIRFFRHDTDENRSVEIPYEEVAALTLSPLLTAPDGINIDSGYQHGTNFFIFGSGGEYGHYLTEGDTKVRLDLLQDFDRYSYRGEFYFIGWILSE